jgi:hypothetical protein
MAKTFWPYTPILALCLLFYFLDPIYSRQSSLDGGSAHLKAAVYIKDNTKAE